MTDIPLAAKHALCKAYKARSKWAHRGLYLMDRTLSYKTWATRGEIGRHDIAPLYKEGLIAEWFSPWSPPLYLTEAGVKRRAEFRKELGYDD